jgi:hypothetical protein
MGAKADDAVPSDNGPAERPAIQLTGTAPIAAERLATAAQQESEGLVRSIHCDQDEALCIIILDPAQAGQDPERLMVTLAYWNALIQTDFPDQPAYIDGFFKTNPDSRPVPCCDADYIPLDQDIRVVLYENEELGWAHMVQHFTVEKPSPAP